MDKMYGALILSGGNSRRMGNYPKALLPVNQTSFLNNIIQTYRSCGITNIVAVLNPKLKNSIYSAHLKKIKKHCLPVYNNNVSKGRIYSIQSGLAHLSDCSHIFIHNIDTPNVSALTINKMIEASDTINAPVISPFYNNKKGHPVLIESKVANEIKKVNDYTKILKDILQSFHSYTIRVEDYGVIENINTPSDYLKYIEGIELTEIMSA